MTEPPVHERRRLVGLHAVTSPAEARAVVRTEAARGGRVLKIWVDARDERRSAWVKLAPDINAAALDEAEVRDVRVIAHANTLKDHKRLLGRRSALRPHALGWARSWLGTARRSSRTLLPTLG